MKKVLISLLLIGSVSTAFAQQTPEELKDKFLAACEAGDKEAMMALYYPKEQHKEIAELLVSAYLNPDKYYDFFVNAKDFYGEDPYKKNVSIGGFALGMLMFTPCGDDVEIKFEKKSDVEAMLYYSPNKIPNMRGRVRFENIDGKWWVHQSPQEDYNQLMGLLQGADKTVELGNKLLAEKAPIEKFGAEMAKLTQEIEASMKK